MNATRYQRPPLRVALLGLGRAMFETHYPVFKAHPALFQVVCACDLIRERRDIVARDFPACKMFRRLSDMLDEREIDLVDIATPTVNHVHDALASLKRGFWTLVETPMALTYEDALILKGAALKAKGRLLVLQRGFFAPDFLLARQMMADARLGTIHEIVIRREDYVRRDDWQCVKRLGGGAAYYEMCDLILQAMKLLPLPPVQMWSDLKRTASTGDAEDDVRVCLKTREQVSADIRFSGGAFPGDRSPSFTLRGDRGVFKVEPDAREGTLLVLDPAYKLPRRRASVRTPPFRDMHEKLPLKTLAVALPRNTVSGPSAFWKHVYDTVRTAAPFPMTLEDAIETVKFAHLMKKTSPFGV